MYPYNYNISKNNKFMYYPQPNYQNPNDERFIVPLLLGGVAGYAIGNNNAYNNQQPIGYFYPQIPQPNYYPNAYYSSSNNYFYPYHK